VVWDGLLSISEDTGLGYEIERDGEGEISEETFICGRCHAELNEQEIYEASKGAIEPDKTEEPEWPEGWTLETAQRFLAGFRKILADLDADPAMIDAGPGVIGDIVDYLGALAEAMEAMLVLANEWGLREEHGGYRAPEDDEEEI
jgi:hypothetical protein